MGWGQTGGINGSSTVDSTSIIDGAIQAVDLGASCVTSAKIAAGAVSAGKIAAGGVSASSQFAAGVVDATALGALVVTSAKLAADAVTAGKIATGGVSAAAQFAAGVVDNAALAANCVQAANIAALSVGNAALAAGVVTAGKIATGGVSASAQFAAGVVDTAALKAAAVTNAKLGGNATVLPPGLYAAMPVANTVAAGTIYPATDSGGTPYFSDGVTATPAPAGWTQMASSVGASGVADGSITLSKLAAAIKPSGSAATTDEAVRALGYGTNNAAPGPAGCPIGVILPYAAVAAPAGWLLCDGTSYLRATYPALFALIGTAFGSADATHFNVPDMRARVPVGLNNLGGLGSGRRTNANSNTLGGNGGEEVHTLTGTESGVALHNHAAAQASHTHPVNVSWNDIANNTAASNGHACSGIVAAGGNQTTGYTSGPSSDDTVTVSSAPAANALNAHNNMQPYLNVGYIIKT